MCGIAGVISTKFTDEKKSNILYKILTDLNHRGPDSNGYKRIKKGVLGHVRLAIRDLSPLGHQPMSTNDDKFSIVYNGEIYNTEEIKCFLQNKYSWVPSGTSDTEILLNLIAHEGLESSLSKLKGMFAFCFYDKENSNLYLVRDQIGIKPVYFSFPDEFTFIFASEFNALIDSDIGVLNEYSKEGLSLFFERNYIPSPKTALKGIHKLEPGSYLKINIGNYLSVEKKLYYIPKKINKKNNIVDLEKCLRQSVEKHLISDVDVGCFLSGGVDSSLIAYFASKAMVNRLKTFTISFDQEGFDESYIAEKISNHLDTDHRTFKLSNRYIVENVSNILDKMDEPFADSSFIPTYIVSKFASDHVKVCLSGDGGDEAFLGYDKYRSYPKILKRIHSVQKLIKFLPKSFYDSDFISSLLPFNNSLDKLQKLKNIIYQPSIKQRLLTIDSFWHEYPMKDVDRSFDYPKVSNFCDDPLKVLNQIDIHYYLPDDLLTKSDIASMANSLELRVPFCSPEIIELGMTLGSDEKLNKFQGKLALRELQKKFFTNEICDLPKSGFRIPIADWMRGELKEFSYERIETCLLLLNFLDNKAIIEKWNQHQSRECDYSYWLWSFVTLGHWLMRHHRNV